MSLLRRLDVSKLRIKDSLKNINEIDQVVNEGRYHDFRNNEELTPRQKIGHSVREVRAKLTELSKLIDMNVRLKNELGVNSDQYWKNTHKALTKISERLVKLLIKSEKYIKCHLFLKTTEIYGYCTFNTKGEQPHLSFLKGKM